MHNREFEDMLEECKGDVSCSSLLSKGFWWLYRYMNVCIYV